MPLQKKKGSQLMAGTVNGAGKVELRVTRAGKDTQLSQIVGLVQEAQTSRAPIQRMADLVAGYFVPVIILLGLHHFCRLDDPEPCTTKSTRDLHTSAEWWQIHGLSEVVYLGYCLRLPMRSWFGNTDSCHGWHGYCIPARHTGERWSSTRDIDTSDTHRL